MRDTIPGTSLPASRPWHGSAFQGEVTAARVVADAAQEVGAEMGGYFLAPGESVLALAALAAGELETARDASEAAAHQLAANSEH